MAAKDEIRRLIERVGVSRALYEFADVLREMGEDVKDRQPRSSALEMSRAYNASAATVGRAANSIRHKANRVGF